MNPESLLPILENIWDISAIILVAGLILFYFGKLIASSKIWEYEKSDYYIEGFAFCIAHIFLPLILVLTLYEFGNWNIPAVTTFELLNWTIPTFTSLFIAYFFTMILYIGEVFNSARFKLFSKLKNAYNQKVNEFTNSKQNIEQNGKTEKGQFVRTGLDNSYSFQESIAKITSNRYVLIGISVLMVWITISTFYLEPLFSLLSLTTYFVIFINFTLIALQFSYSRLIKPIVRIILDNGLEIEGRILKAGKYVVIMNENEEKTINVNASKILYIEGAMLADGDYSKRIEKEDENKE